MGWMPPLNAQVVAAMVAALGSLVVSLVSFFTTRNNQRSVEGLKADLADRNAQRSARLEYEFEARKRLYGECAPLLFELSELAERALGRIVGLARTAADGNLDPEQSWLKRGYYRRSTYYRLLAPLAIGQLLRRKLTHLDLVVDPATHWQYALCKQLADSFTDDFDLAKFAPEIEYSPHDPAAATSKLENPQRFWQQGVPRGILDNAVASLIRSGQEGSRILDFGEFESRIKEPGDAVARSFERIDYLLDSFTPKTRPVLWRMLLAQAHLYRALLLTREQHSPSVGLWIDLWGTERPDFDWRKPEERALIPATEVTRPVEVGTEYAKERTSALLARLAANPGQ